MVDFAALWAKLEHKRREEIDEETWRELHAPETLEYLMNLINDPNHSVSAYSGRTLALIGEAAIPSMLEATQNPDRRVRVNAVEALSWLDYPDSRVSSRLVEILQHDPDGWIRGEAVYALAEMIQFADIPEVYPLLEHADLALRIFSAYILREKAGVQGVKALIDLIRYPITGDRHEIEYAVKALVGIGKPAVPDLLAALHDDDEFMRQQIINVLGLIGDETAFPAIVNALKDESRDVREAVVYALGNFGESALPALYEAFLNSELRWAAEVVLRHPRAVPGLLKLLRHDDEEVRNYAASTLWLIHIDTQDTILLKMLIEHLKDEDVRVQRAVANTLQSGINH